MQDVIACAALKDIGRAIACQRVIQARAYEVFNPRQAVARRITPKARRPRQANVHARSRGAVIGNVTAQPAHQRIGPGPTDQQVIARPA